MDGLIATPPRHRILPLAPWQRRADLQAACVLLGAEHGEVRFVGGAVRDTLLGLPVADVDLATIHNPAIVVERLAAAGIKTIPTGIAHGTITALLAGGPVEVTTLRADVATDGRHAVVAFTDNWQTDASRRDFTINAMSADPVSRRLFDYFEGATDLIARRVAFIGDPYRRIAEDHLRILRYFRFHARFGGEIDASALAACAVRSNDLMALSRERIAAELMKLLVAPAAIATVRLMIDHAIFTAVLPEIRGQEATDRLAALIAAEAATGIAGDPLRRLAALLPRDPDIADGVAARLRLSKTSRRRLISAAAPAGHEPAHVIVYRIGAAAACDRLLLSGRAADVGRLATSPPFVLGIGGGELVARGIARGPDVARLLRRIEEAWIGEDFPPRERVEAIADQVVADWRALRDGQEPPEHADGNRNGGSGG